MTALLLTAALLVVAVIGEHSTCADEEHASTICSQGSYDSTNVEDADACCALCASEAQCVQWTFCDLVNSCNRTSIPGTLEKNISTKEFTCGIKGSGPTPTPTPPPAPPAPPAPGAGNTWAVIAAGSKGFWNYRHQADACHAYHVLRNSGISRDHIILMMEDDVAGSSENPFKGKLFNRPGSNALDVYNGCNVDYRGSIVTAKLFLSVIAGNESGVPDGGKVLKSGRNDRVFLNFIDHGGVGIVAFPNGPILHVSELATALNTMHQKKLFKEVVFYMEACESGSMFPHLSTDGKILAVTAANANESSWGYYCPPQNDTVHGKRVGSCLGDLFSIAWMEDSDLGQYRKESISTQVERVTERTTKSHVMTFGDTSFEAEPLGNFEASGNSASLLTSDPIANEGALNARDIPMHTAFYKWERAEAGWPKAAAFRELQEIIAARTADEDLFSSITKQICSAASHGCVYNLQKAQYDLKDMRCHRELTHLVHDTCPRRSREHNPGGWNAFNMKFSQLLVNACEQRGQLGKDLPSLRQIVHAECAASVRSAATAGKTVAADKDDVVV